MVGLEASPSWLPLTRAWRSPLSNFIPCLRQALRSLPIWAVALALLGTASIAVVPSSNPRGGTYLANDQSTAVRLADVSNADAAVQRRQAFARIGLDKWHEAGQRGQGVKVAVLDSGFHEYRSMLGKALPANVTVKSFRRDGNFDTAESQHGILCGEVIHAMAPDAELMLVNWETDRPATFLQAARWAIDQGAKVLSCSLIMPSWSDGEGGGGINEELAKTVAGGRAGQGALFFASAGNLAQRHWAGPVRPDRAGFHQWAPGNRNNLLTPWGEERVSVELYGPACAGLELLVFDALTAKEIGQCRASTEGSPSGCPCAVVRFQPRPGSRYVVRLRCDDAKNTNAFHLAALGAGLEHSTSAGSLTFPADCRGAVAVGAVDSGGKRLSYSSCGPNSGLPKPDYVAEVPFPSLWRDRPFAGTSAAAPQAAALATLVWARHPDWTANQVNESLRQASSDLGPLGHDWETGHGLLRLPTCTP